MKIYLTGAENIGWALDTDLSLAQQALSKFAVVSKKAFNCDYIQSVSPNTTYARFEHHGEKFVSVFQGEPKRIFDSDNNFLQFCQNKMCVAQSRQAFEELRQYGLNDISYIPYIADVMNYYFIKDKTRLYNKYRIGQNKFIIGSFMRDSLGEDLTKPKLEKGPDLFVQIVKQVCEEIGYDKVLVLLGGPRRHWIRSELKKNRISYQYIGKEIEEDDMKVNILPANIVNELLNISDLIIVSSRSEGGPRGILEASSALTPIISTDVGIAKDILNREAIYDNIDQAVQLVIQQYEKQELNKLLEENFQIIQKNHSIDCISGLWKEFYYNHSKKNTAMKKYRIYMNDFDKLYALKKKIKKYL